MMSLDGLLSRIDGVALFMALVAFVLWTLRAVPDSPLRTRLAGDDSQAGHRGPAGGGRSPMVVQVMALVGGIGLLALAARFVVSGAEDIASALGVPELIVGLTIVALGTSAPEIVTTVIAVLHGRRELAVGNAVGSNIFNILLVLGVGGSLVPGGIAIGKDAVELDLPILVAAAVACLPMVFWDNKLDRWEGAGFVAYYVAYLIFLILEATGHRPPTRLRSCS